MTCVNYAAFDYRNATREQIDQEQDGLRKYLATQGHMFEWPHNDHVSLGYPPPDVKTFCVEDADWQKIRLSMKGLPTHEKLQILKDWWDRDITGKRVQPSYAVQVQVGNYLGALRRGGQLNSQNQVRRYI